MEARPPKPRYATKHQRGRWIIYHAAGPKIGDIVCSRELKEDAERKCDELNRGVRR